MPKDPTNVLDAYAPPSDLNAEQSLLGACLIEKAAIEAALELAVCRDSFYRGGHQDIWDAIAALHDAGTPADFITVQAALKDAGRLAQIGGESYLAALIDKLPTAANAAHYARIVLEKHTLRRVIEFGLSVVGLGRGQGENQADTLDDVLDHIGGLALALGDGHLQGGAAQAVPLKQILSEAYDWAEARHEAPADTLAGVPTGIAHYDKLTGGLMPKTLVVLAARPGIGKTAALTSWALHGACQKGVPWGILSAEMSREQIGNRILSHLSGVPFTRMRDGECGPGDWDRIAGASQQWYEAPLYIDDTTDLSIAQVRTRARRMVHQHGIRVLGVDYLQLIKGTQAAAGKGNVNRVQELDEVAYGLKSIARELDICVVALSQLSREVEKRPDKRPQMSDIRESGGVEAAADVVALLFRQAYYDSQKSAILEYDEDGSEASHSDSETPHELSVESAELIVGKQRNGATGMVRAAFLPETGKWGNLDTHHGWEAAQAAMAQGTQSHKGAYVPAYSDPADKDADD